MSLLSGSGAPPSRTGSNLRLQLRCQQALLGAARSYLRGRLPELRSGVRRARRASVFRKVRKACNGIPVADLSVTHLPTLGDPCAEAVAPDGGPLDGVRVARCARATLERLSAEMTVGVLRPNVVLVLTDDQNLGSMSSMQRVSDLRRRAVDFTRASVTTPLCAPSRASLLSALYAEHHGIVSNYEAAASFDSSSTLATWVHAAGYKTALIGKYLNYAQSLDSVPPGWDEWQALIVDDAGYNGFTEFAVDENGTTAEYGFSSQAYSTDLLLKRSLTFMRSNANAPFFLLLAPFAPHTPAIPARRHEGDLADLPLWRPPNFQEADVSLKPTWVKFMKANTPPEATAATDLFRIDQLETLLAVDEAVGDVEEALERLGLTDNTVLIFTSDNGNQWGEHWWNSKFAQYEESLRVPLVVSYPVAAPEPQVRDQLVTNVDLAPTIAELTNATVPGGRDGHSFVSLLTGTAPIRPDFLIEQIPAIIVSGWKGVRGERFKYVKTDAGGVNEELYDLTADPYELANLAFLPEHDATLQAMRARLAELTGP